MTAGGDVALAVRSGGTRRGPGRWTGRWIRSRGWAVFLTVAIAVLVGSYVVGIALDAIRPGSVWGMAYGVTAAVLLVAVSLYPVRRRALGVRFLGRSAHYLRLHLYGGTLFLVTVLMHSGFSVPEGVLTGALWSLSILLVAGGFVGTFLQKVIPSILGSGLSVEVAYARIPELIVRTRARARTLADAGPGPLRDLYDDRLAPEMEASRRSWMQLANPTGAAGVAAHEFATVRRLLSGADCDRLDELERLYRTKLELDAHHALQGVLRRWPYIHVPIALAVMGLAVLHVFFVFYY